jgi:tripartite-type tricarboxylate transporter receptor subunit TctC
MFNALCKGDSMLKELILACAVVIGANAPALAQEFPKKQPVKIVVAASAGGLTDALARITAEFLQKRLGQAVVVENKPGAGSVIGADFTAKAPPDGYTIYLAGPEMPVLPATRANLPYKVEDFTFLMRPFTVQPLVVVNPKLPINTMPELVAYMKANPGKARYGSTGVGAIVHMGTAMFESAAGVKGTHVPYPGIAPVYTDLLGGSIDFSVGASVPFLDGLRPIASSGSKRHPAYPNLPSFEEVGLKSAAWDIWFGFVAPPNLPKPIADKLVTELGAALKDPEAIAKIQSATKLAPETSPLIGDAFKRQVLEEMKNWKTVVDREKIVVQQ